MELYAGTLTCKIHGLRTTKLTNAWCQVHFSKSDGYVQLDFYENQAKAESNEVKKSIEIADAKWGKLKTSESTFCLYTKGKRFSFIAKTEEECNSWIQVLCCLSADLNKSYKAGDGQTNDSDDVVVMQDNCLYASSGDEIAETFAVVAKPNAAASKLGLKGLLKLCVGSKSIKAFDINEELKVEWTYHCIRSFGHAKTTLNIYVGTKSPKGPGSFDFFSNEGEEISQLIAFNSQKIRESELCDRPVSREQMGTTSPKPVSPAPLKPNFNPCGDQFKAELSGKIRPPLSPGNSKLPLERQLSSDEKESKRSLKEKEKITKQQLKEKEKLDKKKAKKTEKGGWEKLPAPQLTSLPQGQGSEYSEPFTLQNQTDDDYAECSFENGNELPPDFGAESNVYNDPWESLSIRGAQPNLVNDTDGDDYEGREDIYSLPSCRPSRQINQKCEVSSEDVAVSSPPPIYPPNYSQSSNEDNLNSDLYGHFVDPSVNISNTPESVYGFESAKPIGNNITVKRNPPSHVPQSDIYEIVE